jgi:hypothetical protein
MPHRNPANGLFGYHRSGFMNRKIYRAARRGNWTKAEWYNDRRADRLHLPR